MKKEAEDFFLNNIKYDNFNDDIKKLLNTFIENKMINQKFIDDYMIHISFINDKYTFTVVKFTNINYDTLYTISYE